MLIPPDFINKLLQQTDLVDLIEPYVLLKKTGSVYKALCPFHQEKTPSFTVYPQQQTYHCFGCGTHGNAIEFWKQYHRLSFPQAVEELAQRLGMDLEHTEALPDFKTHYQTLQQVTTLYQQQLQQHPSAQQYLQQRGLSPEIVQAFQLGYAPQAWDFLLKQGFSLEQLKAVGLVSESNHRYFDRFRHRLMFPILNARGQVVGFGGRVLDDSKPKYLNSPESDVFQKSKLVYGWQQLPRDAAQVIVVEGYTDVLRLAQQGIAAVATLGTAVSQAQLLQLFSRVSELVFCFDGDEAGLQAAKRALHTVLPLLVDGRVVTFGFLPAGDDPDSFVARHGKQGFLDFVAQARLLSQFLFDLYLQGSHTPEGMAKLHRQAKTELMPLIEQVPYGQYRRSLLAQLQRVLSGYGVRGIASVERAPKPLSKLEQAIQLLVQHPYLAQEVIDLPARTEETGLFLDIVGFVDQYPDANTAMILANFPELKLKKIKLINVDQFVDLVEWLRIEQRKHELKLKIKQGIISDLELLEFQGLVLK